MEYVVALGICVALPVMIVWLVVRSRNAEIDKKAEVMLKAIDNGMDIDPNLLLPDGRRDYGEKGMLVRKIQSAVFCTIVGLAGMLVFWLGNAKIWILYVGIVFFAFGVGSFVAFFFGKSQFAKKQETEGEKTIDGPCGK